MYARTKAGRTREIKNDIRRVVDNSRPDIEHVHLIASDFKEVSEQPEIFGLTKQADGRIMVALGSKQIEIVELKP